MKTIISLSLILFGLTAQAQNPAPKNADADTSLLKTYQRELAFLQAQKRSLLNQKGEIEKSFVGKVKAAAKELKKDQDILLGLTKTNEVLSAKLIDAERTLESLEGSNAMVDTTLLQGKVSLEIPEEKWETFKKSEEKLSFMFEQAASKMASDSSVYTQEREFFTPEGKLVKGETLQIGRVATFGQYQGQTAALMPAGLGKLKMSESSFLGGLDRLTGSNEFSMIPVFLYENTAKGIEVKKDKSFMDIVHAGGSIAYVIVGLGILALVLVIIRGALLFSAGKVDHSLLDKISSGDLTELENLVAKRKTPFDRVLGNIFLARNKEREARESIIHESILGELNFLDKFGAIILVMAAVAPLLGLLGTVTGMISTFDIITEFGTGDPKLLSSGISEALITTKLGLVVAIPSLLLGNLLGGWSGKIKVLLEREALRLSNRFDKDVLHG
jgi:biopolymer transport protein ExbB